MSYRKKILGNSFFFGLAEYQENIIGLLISILVARQLGAEDYGRYSLMLWFVALGVMLVAGGVITSIIKFVAELRGSGSISAIPSVVGYNRKILYFKFPFAIGIIAILLLLLDHKLPDNNVKYLFWIVLLAILPKCLQAFYVSVLKGMESFRRLFWVNVIVTPVNLLAVIAVVIAGGGIYSFVCLYLGISMLYFLVSSYFANREIRKKHTGQSPSPAPLEKKRMNRQIRLLYFTGLVGFFVDRQMEVFFLNMFATPEAAGYYNVAFLLSVSAVDLIPGLVVGVLLPVMAKSTSESLQIQAYRYREAGRYLMLLTAPVIIFVAAYSDHIISLLYGKEYHASALPLAILVLSSVLGPLAGSASSILVSHERQHLVLRLILVFAVLNIVLDYILIKLFALNGAVIGFSIIKLGLSAALLAMAARLLNTRLDYFYYFKALLISCLAVLPLLYLKQLAFPVAIFFLAGLLFVVTYFVLIVQLRMIKDDDIEVFRYIANKLPGGHFIFTERLFAWMESRQC